MTVTSPMTGNFGNNLFSYIITRCVALENNYDFGMNRHPEFDYYGGQPQLDFFDLDYGREHDYKYDETPIWISNIWKEKFTHHKTNNDEYDFHNYQPDVYSIPDGTKIVISSMQDERYYTKYKDQIKKWLTINKDFKAKVILALLDHDIILDDNVTILNGRGGEYRGINNLILRKEYWDHAMQIMLDKNPKMKFIGVSDDPQYFASLLDNKIPIIHFGIGGDYTILNLAKNIIISNSSFAIFPCYTNPHDPYIIAPFGWARANVTTGYFASSDMTTWGWNFMNREGKIV